MKYVFTIAYKSSEIIYRKICLKDVVTFEYMRVEVEILFEEPFLYYYLFKRKNIFEKFYIENESEWKEFIKLSIKYPEKIQSFIFVEPINKNKIII
jgi:hypothetical protein